MWTDRRDLSQRRLPWLSPKMAKNATSTWTSATFSSLFPTLTLTSFWGIPYIYIYNIITWYNPYFHPFSDTQKTSKNRPVPISSTLPAARCFLEKSCWCGPTSCIAWGKMGRLRLFGCLGMRRAASCFFFLRESTRGSVGEDQWIWM